MAIDTDLASDTARAKPLDADAKGALSNIHRRVGTAMLFESSGGQVDRVAHLPELRFALGEPEVETTTVDNAAAALEQAGFFIRKVGADGYRIHHQATLRKAVADLRASLNQETEVKPAIRALVQREFAKGNDIPKVYFPEDSNAVPDDPRMTFVVMNPDDEWRDDGHIAERIAQWTKERGRSSRLYPAALVWCCSKPGRDLQDRVELWLAWQKIKGEIDAGNMGPEFERSELNTVTQQIRNAEQEAVEEAHASYRFISLGDFQAESGIKTIDLGAGHSGSTETPSGRVVNALRNGALLNESVGAGYIDRNWPPALKENGAWPLSSLRQSFLNGSLTRLLDPDKVLRQKILEFVEKGEFGLASGGIWSGELQQILVPSGGFSGRGDFQLGHISDNQGESRANARPTGPEAGTGAETSPRLSARAQANSERRRTTAISTNSAGDNPATEGHRAAGELEHGGPQDRDETPAGQPTQNPSRTHLGGRTDTTPDPEGRHPAGPGGPQTERASQHGIIRQGQERPSHRP